MTAVLLGMLNDEFVVCLLGSIPAHLTSRPQSLQYVHGVTAVSANFENLYISQGGVATHLRCGGIFNDCFTAYFLHSAPVKKRHELDYDVSFFSLTVYLL